MEALVRPTLSMLWSLYFQVPKGLMDKKKTKKKSKQDKKRIKKRATVQVF